MTMPDNLLPPALLLAAGLLWLLILLTAIWGAPWRRFWRARVQPVYLGAIGALLGLWSLDVTLVPGLGFHFLGVTVFTLMFGWSLAVLGIALVAAACVLLGGGSWPALALDTLLLGVLPASISYGVYVFVHRYLPHHIFVYVFLCAFFAAIASAAAAVGALVAVLVSAEVYAWPRVAEEYLPFLPLYLFPEGLLNGMLAMALIGLRPEWLKTFDEEAYLGH